MKSSPILVILALSLVILSCRETFGEQHKDIDKDSNLPSQKNHREADSVPGFKESKPTKSVPSKKRLKARDTLKPKIAALHQSD